MQVGSNLHELLRRSLPEKFDEGGLLRPFHQLGNLRHLNGRENFDANQLALRVIVGHQNVFDDFFRTCHLVLGQVNVSGLNRAIVSTADRQLKSNGFFVFLHLRHYIQKADMMPMRSGLFSTITANRLRAENRDSSRLAPARFAGLLACGFRTTSATCSRLMPRWLIRRRA